MSIDDFILKRYLNFLIGNLFLDFNPLINAKTNFSIGN